MNLELKRYTNDFVTVTKNKLTYMLKNVYTTEVNTQRRSHLANRLTVPCNGCRTQIAAKSIKRKPK